MKNTRKSLIGFLKRYWYFLLLVAAGSLAIGESARITKTYQPSKWIAGPSGFIMILGLILLALLLFEVLMTILKNRRRARATETAATEKRNANATPSDTTQAQEEKQHAVNMWLSFGLLVAYTLLLKVLGFALASAFYLLANLPLLKNSWKVTVITVVVVLAFLLLAAPALGIAFPRGLFGF